MSNNLFSPQTMPKGDENTSQTWRPTLSVIPSNENTPTQQDLKQRKLNNAGKHLPRAQVAIRDIYQKVGYNNTVNINPEGYESPTGYFGQNPATNPNIHPNRLRNRSRFPFARRKHPPIVLPKAPTASRPLPSTPVGKTRKNRRKGKKTRRT